MKPPKPEEHAPFMGNYINLIINTPDVIALLEQQTNAVFDLFSKLSEEKAMHAYGPDKWTLKQVLGHIIDTERTFAYRAFAFSRGQAELPGFDENTYVELADFNKRNIADLAAEFKAVRAADVFLIRNLRDDQLEMSAISNGILTSVRALVYAMAGHIQHHLNIVRERYLSE
ncbi:DinB family protein [Mucilaginibacter auburnensis]|uniref:DinB family protein n=1 Tax=Mucilaginibacter auburnensis TaxID=1457233 RepID=A0A2H9VTI5_9SPHI|nr:DinB family protein [Mucilaginibacter auburnensis]PJJ84102.1 DinB family protein [Mucilaginibacter auburnensis]